MKKKNAVLCDLCQNSMEDVCEFTVKLNVCYDCRTSILWKKTTKQGKTNQ